MPARAFDIAIIGAGLCGASAAHFLSGRGASVALIDRGASLVAGASARPGGMLLTGIADHYNRVARGVGRAEAAAIWRATREGGRLAREAVARRGVRCDLEARGSWALAANAAEAADLDESRALLAEDCPEIHARLLSQRDLELETHAPGGLSALALDDDLALDAAALARNLVATIESEAGSGLTVLRGVGVRSLETGGDGARLETDAGEVAATIAIIAAGAEAGRLVRFLQPLVWPIRGQGFVTAPLPPLLARGVTAGWGHEHYRQLPDGRLVVAGLRPDAGEEDATLDARTTPVFQGFLEKFARQRLPALAGLTLEVERRFAVIEGFSQDGLPLIGAVPGMPALLVACGFTLSGLALGVFAGRALAEMALEGKRDVPGSFSPGRFL